MKKVLILILLLPLLAGCGNNKQKEHSYDDWVVFDYLNDFYEPTGDKYVIRTIDGHFSNSYSANNFCKVCVIIYKTGGGLEGRITLDEFNTGKPDMTIYNYGNPAQPGSKIIDLINRKKYTYHYPDGFHDMDEKSQGYKWVDIFRNNESVYKVVINGESHNEYEFSIITYGLNSALKEAGIIK